MLEDAKKVNSKFRELAHFVLDYSHFDGLGWWIIDFQNDPDHFYCNVAMKKMFGLDLSQERYSISQTCPIAGEYNKHVKEEDAATAQKIFDDYQAILDNKSDKYENAFPYLLNGERKYFKSQAKVLMRDEEGKVLLLHGIILDVTHEKTLEEQLTQERKKFQSLSETDPLTQLHNRRKFEDLFSYMLHTANRIKKPLGVAMLDIDYFKLVNDYLGHQAGDETLKEVAQTIKANFQRENDITARYGGEEFIIAAFCDTKEIFATLLERLQNDLRTKELPNPKSPLGKYLTVSIGGFYYDPSKKTLSNPDLLIHKADLNLYLAKNRGRNKIIVSDE